MPARLGSRPKSSYRAASVMNILLLLLSVLLGLGLVRLGWHLGTGPGVT
ncbi:hypothetical protein GCM10022407_11120 [Hymenobacter antarcticus]|uniref:Uncharacterized protein n=1 Tax=Hymenobacter antarcticus TaxID=486270 RepID=A0ABP7PJK1_9BACT